MAVGSNLAGWTPIGAEWEADRASIRWCFTEGLEFTDPFFDDTIRRALQDPFRLLFWRRTDIDQLTQFAREHPGLTPAGIVFHLSRSGSTLLAQMFAALDNALVMSEPAPFDQVLRLRSTRPTLPQGTVVDWLVSMTSALGQPRRPDHRHFILKLDAWAILDWPLIRAAFPETPTIFVYRDPTDVLVSQLGHRGYHMVPGTLTPEVLGIAAEQIPLLRPEEYGALVLARLCSSALDAAQHGGVGLIHYESLPASVADTIAPAFGIEIGAHQRAVFDRVAALDAKNPQIAFEVDSMRRERLATAEIRSAVDTWVRPVYQSLEALRDGQCLPTAPRKRKIL